jgi:sporulation protein YlmC with PRC-barrel domain
MEEPTKPRTLLLRDIVDGQLRGREGRRLGRVVDIEAEWTTRGLYLRRLVLGPEAHLGRLGARLGAFAHRFLRGRYEHTVDVDEIEEIGPSVLLKQTSDAYETGNADEWIVEHVFRFIPGSRK